MTPALNSESRLMLIAAHPDDETLACSIILQRAVRAGAAVRVIYATDGDDNPWPQRLLERKWRLNSADRKRWGELRRTEALAALRVLGVSVDDARFLALPDQGLTNLLRCDCRSALQRFATIIRDWLPTHLLVPSIADTHPDHSALAVALRLVLAEFSESQISIWSYAVHGRSDAFFSNAQSYPQLNIETVTKLRAIRCHKTQTKLSRRRFFGYAARPERFLRLRAREATIADGSIHSISRESSTLCIKLKLGVKPMRIAEPALFVLGHDVAGALRCLRMQLPVRSSRVEMFECAGDQCHGAGRYRGNAFAGELTIPLGVFSQAHALFVKLERRSWFFDEAGWLEIPPAPVPEKIVEPLGDILEERSLAIR